MLFNSIEFLVFFPIFLLIYYCIPDRYSKIWLLVSSYFFYMSWNAQYGLLIMTSTIITYLCAKLIWKYRNIKKLILVFGLLSNLGILFFFKYFNMGIDILNFTFRMLHIGVRYDIWDIVLPVGISFYTFQALGYLIDVYRGDIEAEGNFVDYALFVSFFPQLVAGPIERSVNLLPQIKRRQPFLWDNFGKGLLFMLWGYFMKLMIADRIALYVDEIWENMDDYVGIYVLIAIILFAIQIYCDFYGYSMIAMGTARIIGVQLIDNFQSPFMSETISEFWRRWHISLNDWFRDYLYIPLGGNRRGPIRRRLNSIIVFAVSGLWHGARISYVVWGLVNAVYVFLSNITLPIRDKLLTRLFREKKFKIVHLLRFIGTFILFDFSLIFFRSNGLRESIKVINRLTSIWHIDTLGLEGLLSCGLNLYDWVILMICICILLMADMCKKSGIILSDKIMCEGDVMVAVVSILCICIILTFGIWGPAFDKANFIYFQF